SALCRSAFARCFPGRPPRWITACAASPRHSRPPGSDRTATPRPSATALAPTTLALARSPTCDWTCELLSGISFSRRLSPLKRDSQPELYPSSGESRCFLFLRFQLNAGHPLTRAFPNPQYGSIPRVTKYFLLSGVR